MKRKIFRQKAVDKLASPERLDQLIQVTTPRSWILLLVLFMLLAVFVAWGVLGRVTTRVQGHGIMLAGQVREIVPDRVTGRVDKLFVTEGDMISVDDPVLRVKQTELLERVRNAESRLLEFERERELIRTFEADEERIQAEYFATRRRDLEQSVASHERLVQRWTTHLDAQEQLVEQGIITRETLIPAQDGLSETRDRYEQAQAELNRLRSAELDTRIDWKRKLILSEQSVAEARHRLQELRLDVQLRSEVRSPYSGRVLALAVDEGDYVWPGRTLVLLSATDDSSASLRVVLFVDGREGKKISVCDKVRVAPATVKPEEYGYIAGRVRRVASFPSTTDGMLRLLRSDQLVRQLSAGGSSYQVDVDLCLRGSVDPEVDPCLPDGDDRVPSSSSASSGRGDVEPCLLDSDDSTPQYRWTLGRGPQAGSVTIDEGTLASGLIVVDEHYPAELIIPGLKKKLNPQ